MQTKYELLLELSKLSCIDNGELEETFGKVTECLAKGLGLDRTSIWFYGPGEVSIVCRDMYQIREQTHSNGLELFAKDFPSYFSFLNEERTLAATDARQNPATKEFTEVYLKPLNIFSMLDAPIRVNGKMVGVICSESVGQIKEWTLEDKFFVGNVSDIISRALQAAERIKALNKLEELNQSLEKIIEARTNELEEQRARSIQASKMASLGEMAGSIAHEINNPVSIILTTLSVIHKLRATEKLTPERLTMSLSNIEQTAFRIDKIVRGLRSFARDASNDSHRPEKLFKIIEDTLTLCDEKLRIQECEVIVDVPATLRINCSSVELSQAILNLISNSIDALEGCSEKWIKIAASRKEDRIVLTISDSGAGVDSKIREKIMLPFFTTKAIGKGTGLGLAIVDGIIKQHNGEFSMAENTPETTFVISLPEAS